MQIKMPDISGIDVSKMLALASGALALASAIVEGEQRSHDNREIAAEVAKIMTENASMRSEA